ncbi:50S ribosomal protein L25/general stress protein Ctc [Virgibacillus sp. MSJ-26]|uniref:50S ribosomal protein L25/general stress protein Ctc n=1 Tax=Virgibacillus sp. MSJ-26 TaxID=2841522 RepID=UPI001C111BD7|nr:50S ribosomal protein L25/general stress protein Ctc [Virgibacillus sp. MSJ-26]MBU5467404.1 50S ribosomal protein L25/general stress protein Ctc [Virgibacillus sp. MSJ-26]
MAKLKAVKREDHTTSATKKLRGQGQVPAVVYGKDKETKSIAVNSIELVKTVRDEGRNAIISLDVENDKSVEVMLHDYQMDMLKDELIHADFYIVDMSEEMDVDVAIRLDGEAAGTKEGGVLQQPLFELVVRAKPNNIPDEIVVDVSDLDIGDSITIADLPKSDKYEILEEEDTAVATVTAPTEEEDLEPSDEDESAEPELVGAEDDEEEEQE